VFIELRVMRESRILTERFQAVNWAFSCGGGAPIIRAGFDRRFGHQTEKCQTEK